MKTSVHEDRLIVVSDIHLGNSLHKPGRAIQEFLRFALEHKYSICINGDGIDIAQLSLTRLHADLTPSLGLLVGFGETRRRIYHTVGNHDIALEHFLSEFGRIMVVPFLNVYSGNKRIRIEHGHMYDEMFIKFPGLYYLFTMIGRMAITISPEFYDKLHHFNVKFIEFAEWVLSGFGLKKKPPKPPGAIDGERDCFRHGAEDVGVRGFDAVIFGHTHFAGTADLPGNVKYYNTGGWFSKPWCVVIDRGQFWFGEVKDLVAGKDPFPRHDVDQDVDHEFYSPPSFERAAPVLAVTA